jgi:hypothetical protein
MKLTLHTKVLHCLLFHGLFQKLLWHASTLSLHKLDDKCQSCDTWLFLFPQLLTAGNIMNTYSVVQRFNAIHYILSNVNFLRWELSEILGSMISQKQTDVSEMLTASIIRVILMMDAVRTTATSEYFYEARQHNIPEGSHLHTCHHENPKFNFIFNVCDVQWNSFKKTPLRHFPRLGIIIILYQNFPIRLI